MLAIIPGPLWFVPRTTYEVDPVQQIIGHNYLDVVHILCGPGTRSAGPKVPWNPRNHRNNVANLLAIIPSVPAGIAGNSWDWRPIPWPSIGPGISDS